MQRYFITAKAQRHKVRTLIFMMIMILSEWMYLNTDDDANKDFQIYCIDPLSSVRSVFYCIIKNHDHQCHQRSYLNPKGFQQRLSVFELKPRKFVKIYSVMKKVFGFILLLLVAFAGYWFFIRKSEKKPKVPKMQPLAVKQHSDAFNTSVDNLMAAYFAMKDAFVDADTAKAKAEASRFNTLIDSIPLKELQKDDSAIVATAGATITDIKTNVDALLQQTDITLMRQDFRTVSDMLYPAFFKIINYEGPNLYLQNCPMAFDGDKDANWISNTDQVVNPYLGKNHPKYKGTMLNCGETKDSIVSK